jgi:hypothetical protein
MPVFQVDIQQKVANDFLTNIYHVSVATFTDAAAAAIQIATIHAAGLPTSFFVTAARASTPAAGDGAFITYPLNFQGGRGQAGQNLPLWNRFLVSFNPGFTFQNRKFYPGIMETDQVDGQVLPSSAAEINTMYVTPLINLGFLCSPSGSLYVSGVCKSLVAMRQLRRRKKRTTPVI